MDIVSRRTVGLEEIVLETTALADDIGTVAAVARVLGYLTPDGDAADFLIRRGLASEVEVRLAAARHIGAEPTQLQVAIKIRGRGAGGASHPDGAFEILSHLNILERIKYQGADGKRKSLEDVTPEDCRYQSAITHSHKVAYGQRSEWWDRADALLAQEGKAKVRELSVAAHAELVRMAEATPWKK